MADSALAAAPGTGTGTESGTGTGSGSGSGTGSGSGSGSGSGTGTGSGTGGFSGVVLFARAGGLRALRADQIGAFSYSIELYGGFGESLLALHGPIPEIEAGDRVEMWRGGLLQYRGFISDITLALEEPETFNLRAYGRLIDFGRIKVSATLILPLGADISVWFARIVNLWVRPVLPEAVLTVDLPNVALAGGEFDPKGKTVQECFNDLCDIAGGSLFWGVDVDPATGLDRLYVGRTGAALAVAELPSGGITAASGGLQTGDIANRLTLTGGKLETWQQNLLPNPSFEEIMRAGTEASSGGIVAGCLIVNPGFEDGSTHDGGTMGWNKVGTAFAKLNGQNDNNLDGDFGDPDALEGQWCIELSHSNTTNAQVNQTVNGIIAGRAYRFRCFARPSDIFTVGRGEVRLEWLDSGNNQVRQDVVLTNVDRAAWSKFEAVFIAPTGAVKVAVRIYVAPDGSSLLYDAVQLWDADSAAARGWRLRAVGGAGVVAAWGESASPRQGIYYGRATVQNAGEGADFVHLFPAEPIDVTPGATYLFYGWFRTPGQSVHAGELRLQFKRQDGKDAGTPAVYAFSGSGIGAWSYGFVYGTAPRDAVAVTPSARFKSSGTWEFDAFTLIEDRGADWLGVNADNPSAVPGDGIVPWIEGDTLYLTFRAEDLISAGEDTAVNTSAAVYGAREAAETVESIVTIGAGRAFARAFFLRRAKPRRQVPISYPAGGISAVIGGAVRLIGNVGARYGGGEDLPVSRIRYTLSADGRAAETAELGAAVPTLPALIREGARAELQRVR